MPSTTTTSAGVGLRYERGPILLALMVSTGLIAMDATILATAVPSVVRDLGGFSQFPWLFSVYLLAQAVSVPVYAKLADTVGRKPLILLGIGLFLLGSVLCGFAWSMPALIAFRAVQGLGGALPAPAALSILMTTFSEGRERNVALGIWGAASGSGGAAGVLLGGLLTSALSWSWVFFINVPVGAAVLAVTPWLLRESRSELRHRHFDVAGATSVTAGLMLLVYALTRTASSGWSDARTIGLLVAAAVLVASFVAIELRSAAPLLPLRIFRRRTLAAANAIAFLVGAMAFSQFFVLTLYAQQVLHYSALQTGAGFAATTVAIVVFANVGQTLVTRLGVRPVLAFGLLLVSASFADLTRLPAHGHYFWDLFPAFLVSGIGMAFTFVPMTIAGLTGVPPADAGVASGLINTTRQIGGAVGLAAVSTIAAASATHGLAPAAAGADLTHGFRTAFDVLTGLALLSVAVAVAFVGPAARPVATEPTEEPRVVPHLEEAA
jgi:EmrB/QacA subfamily drug resistance transporter